MKLVTILLLHMQHGGIEKQTITFANELVKKYRVNIISMYDMNSKPAYPVDSRVNVTYLMHCAPNRKEFKEAIKNKHFIRAIKEGIKAVRILINKKRLMKKAIKNIKEGYILSTRIEFADMLSKYANKDVVKMTQEHLNDSTPKYINRVKKAFRNLDYLVVLGPGSNENYSKWLQDNKKIKIVEIPNILEEIPKVNAELAGKNIVSVGRLHPVKGFDRLINIFKKVSERVEDSTLTIVGGGDEREKLENLIDELNLKDKVKITGMLSSEEVKNKMLESSVYAMTSLSECLPMVLLEAASLGIPLVAYDVPVGPKAIIKNGENGYLIEDNSIDKIVDKIVYLLEHEEERKKMGKIAKEYANKYLAENVMPLWYKVFDEEQ